MSRYGIIDLGSNTIRLCIYELKSEDTTSPTRKDINVLLNYKTMAGLASFVKDNEISKKGIKKAINAIRAHLQRASHFNCEEIHIFATAVIRNCSNSDAAAKAIAEGCGVSVSVLSTKDEAYYGFVGANLDQTIDNGLLVDIGGGSTELSVVFNNVISTTVSIPQGSLSSFSQNVTGIIPDHAERNEIRLNFIDNLRHANFDLIRCNKLYGIGGSIRSAAKVYGDMCNEGNRSLTLLPEQLDELLDLYSKNPNAFLHKALQTIPDRIHTFIPGCIIIREIFSITRAKELAICRTGIREGYLVKKLLSSTKE